MKNILCIRADNMGDLVMSSPALRALYETFSCKITVLTSSMAAGIAAFIPYIHEVMVYNLPWVKMEQSLHAEDFHDLIQRIKEKSFDAAIIFTVYSQNPLPAAMLAYLCGIPVRLAYCRENPYALLTHWVPEKEPYSFIRHQVKRDLELVASLGAFTSNDQLSLTINPSVADTLKKKLLAIGIDSSKPYIILHAPVSEEKRLYPADRWIEAGKQLAAHYQLALTGTCSEKPLTDHIAEGIGEGAFSVAGLFPLEEFIALVQGAALVISVNTGTIHIAAAVQTPVVVLYALTNPQHTPWKVKQRILPFSVKENLRSKNEVIRHVDDTVFSRQVLMASPAQIVAAANILLAGQALYKAAGAGT